VSLADQLRIKMSQTQTVAVKESPANALTPPSSQEIAPPQTPSVKVLKTGHQGDLAHDDTFHISR
jgi:hypothetical protein